MNYAEIKELFNRAYLPQLGFEYTIYNVDEYGATGDLRLLYEDERVVVIENTVSEPMFCSTFVSLINRVTLEMTTLETG